MSRMSDLVEQFVAGDISREELVERITAFEWRRSIKMPPPGLTGLEGQMWGVNHMPVGYEDDSEDEFDLLRARYPQIDRELAHAIRTMSRVAPREDPNEQGSGAQGSGAQGSGEQETDDG